MEKEIFDWIAKALSAALPENVQILPLLAATERDCDLVKVGVSPAAPVAIGCPFRVMDLTIAAGVRRRLPDAISRLDRIFAVLQNWIGAGRRDNTTITGVCVIDAIQPTPGSPYVKGVDDSEEYVVSTISAKIYATQI